MSARPYCVEYVSGCICVCTVVMAKEHRTDSEIYKYHLFIWSDLNFLHNSQWITFSTQSYTLFSLICCIRLLYDWSCRLNHPITSIWRFVACYLFLLWHSLLLWRCFVVHLVEIQFLSKCFPILQSCSSLLVWVFVCLLLEKSIQLSFFPILLSCNCCSLDPCVVFVVSGHCN